MGGRVPISVALMKANNKSLKPLLTGFDPAYTCIEGVLSNFTHRIVNEIGELLCKCIDVPSLQDLLVHVQVLREDIYDSSFLVGAVTLQSCALAMGIALRTDHVCFIDLDWFAQVRRMAVDTTYHAGILGMLERHPDIKALVVGLNTVEPLRVLLMGRGVDVVGFGELGEFVSIARRPPLFGFHLPQLPKRKSVEEQADERGESNGEGESSGDGQASGKEGGKEGCELDDRKISGSEGRRITKRKLDLTLPQQSNGATYTELWIQEKFRGDLPYRIIVPHLTDFSNYGLALLLPMLLRKKAAGDFPEDSLLHAATEAVLGTFDYGTLRGDTTVTRVSERLAEISINIAQSRPED